MTRLTLGLMAAVALVVATTAASADETTPVERGPVAAFVDANGDGINDNAPDHDGDGIVNHLDPDYQPRGLGMGRGAKGKFVDENADGINDLAPDDDGDGIPNGQDKDFVRPEAGQGKGRRAGKAGGARGAAGTFVDADGDGICDNAIDSDGDGIADCRSGAAEARGQATGRRGRGNGRGR